MKASIMFFVTIASICNAQVIFPICTPQEVYLNPPTQTIFPICNPPTQTIVPICNPPSQAMLPICVPEEQQTIVPIFAPPDPSVQAVRNICAETGRLVQQINATIPPEILQETPLQRAFRFSNEVMSETDPERLRQMSDRWQVIGRNAESQTQSALNQRQSMAWEMKNRADQEYSSQTGHDFNTSERPSTPSPLQDAYDECNYIHQIWDN